MAIHREVAQLSGCLGALSPSSQRLLVVAAGYATGHWESVAQVGRSLHLQAAEVVTRERAALTRLETAHTNGRCGGSSGAIPVTALPAAPDTLVLLSGPQPGSAQFVAAATGHQAPARTLGLSARAQVSGQSAPAQATQHPAVLAASLGGGPSGTTSPLGAPAIAIFVLAGLGMLTILARQRTVRREPALVGAAAGSEDMARGAPLVAAAAAPVAEPAPVVQPAPTFQPADWSVPQADPVVAEAAPVPVTTPVPAEPAPSTLRTKEPSGRAVRAKRERWQVWAGVTLVVAGAAARQLLRVRSRRPGWARRLRRR